MKINVNAQREIRENFVSYFPSCFISGLSIDVVPNCICDAFWDYPTIAMHCTDTHSLIHARTHTHRREPFFLVPFSLRFFLTFSQKLLLHFPDHLSTSSLLIWNISRLGDCVTFFHWIVSSQFLLLSSFHQTLFCYVYPLSLCAISLFIQKRKRKKYFRNFSDPKCQRLCMQCYLWLFLPPSPVIGVVLIRSVPFAILLLLYGLDWNAFFQQ